MKYNSPYRAVLLLEKKKLMEKEREIILFRVERSRLQQKLDTYTQQEKDFYDFLIEGSEFDALMLQRNTDKKGKYAILKLIEKADEKIKALTIDYANIQHRMDVIRDLDKEKEKAFNKEKEKRESKKIESIMLVKKRKEDAENGGD